MVETFINDPRLFHVFVGMLALVIWSIRDVRRNIYSTTADVIGVITILFALLFAKEFVNLFTRMDAKDVTNWFIFYLAITFWTVPIFTVLGTWFFGRILGRVLRGLTHRLRT